MKPKTEQDWALFRRYVKAPRGSARAKEIQTKVVDMYRAWTELEVDRFARRRTITRTRTSLEDYNQVALEGLLCALDKYDPERGLQFVTPARYWVYFYLDKYHDKVPAVNQRRMSAIPQHLLQRQDKIKARLGRDATAAELGVTEAQLTKWRYPPMCQSIEVAPYWRRDCDSDRFLAHLMATESSAPEPPTVEDEMIDIEEADAQEDQLDKLAKAMRRLTVPERRLAKKTKPAPEEQLEYQRVLAKLRADIESQ